MTTKEKCRLWHEKGMTKKDIARYLCLPDVVVAKYCRGIHKHYPSPHMGSVMADKRKGWTAYELAQHFGKSEAWIEGKIKAWRKRNIKTTAKPNFEGLPSVVMMP